MILFDLLCSRGHRFEGWFPSGADYDRQAEAGVLTCPLCGDAQVHKAPTALKLLSRRDDTAAEPERVPSDACQHDVNSWDAAEMADRVRAQLLEDCEDVGARFAEEARAIHYGEATARGIYGEASVADVAELCEEGISVVPLPFPVKADA
ncbi:MAG: DUF1178 family protein [Rhodothalassiaceae bacterium]